MIRLGNEQVNQMSVWSPTMRTGSVPSNARLGSERPRMLIVPEWPTIYSKSGYQIRGQGVCRQFGRFYLPSARQPSRSESPRMGGGGAIELLKVSSWDLRCKAIHGRCDGRGHRCSSAVAVALPPRVGVLQFGGTSV
jgi:hypothetical protein